MGYRIMPGAAPLAAGISDGNLNVLWYDGTIKQFPCTYKHEIPMQCNVWDSNVAILVLVDDGKLFVGNSSGLIMVLDGDEIVSVETFKNPYNSFYHVGIFVDRKIYAVGPDKQLVYVDGQDGAWLMDTKVPACNMQGPSHLVKLGPVLNPLLGGEFRVSDHGRWYATPVSKRPGYRINF